MTHDVVKTLPVAQDGPVLKDQIIRLSSRKALQAELPEIRRVEYRDTETGQVYVFVTNHRLGRTDRGRYLQVPLGGRAVLQVDQAEPEEPQLPGPEPKRRRLADLRGAVRLPAGGFPEVRLADGHRHPSRATRGAIEPVPAQTPDRSPPRPKTRSTRSLDASATEGRLSGTTATRTRWLRGWCSMSGQTAQHHL